MRSDRRVTRIRDPRGRRAGLALIALALAALAPGCGKKEVKLELTRETVVRPPDIGSLRVEPTGRVDTRQGPQKVEVFLRGDPDLTATFDVRGLVENRAMEQVEPGLYRGTFVVPQGSTGTHDVVARLLHEPSGARNETSVAGGLTLFESAPVETGCTTAMREAFDRELRQIELRFAANVHALTEPQKAELAAKKPLLESNPECRIFVLGHASQEGADNYNFLLSTFRALSVYQTLQSLGIPAERLERNFLGEQHPLDDSGTPEALAKNRRVEIRAVYPY